MWCRLSRLCSKRMEQYEYNANFTSYCAHSNNDGNGDGNINTHWTRIPQSRSSPHSIIQHKRNVIMLPQRMCYSSSTIDNGFSYMVNSSSAHSFSCCISRISFLFHGRKIIKISHEWRWNQMGCNWKSVDDENDFQRKISVRVLSSVHTAIIIIIGVGISNRISFFFFHFFLIEWNVCIMHTTQLHQTKYARLGGPDSC